MPIDDDYLDQLIKKWTEQVKAIPVEDWSAAAMLTRRERYQRRRRRRRLVGLVVGLAVCTAVFLTLHYLAG